MKILKIVDCLLSCHYIISPGLLLAPVPSVTLITLATLMALADSLVSSLCVIWAIIYHISKWQCIFATYKLI